MEMIHSASASSFESYGVSRHYKDRILDFKTDNSYWGSGHYCMQGDLIVWSQSHEQLAG